MLLGVVRLEIATDFGSKEVEPMLMRELSMDSPHTVFGTVSTFVLDRKCPCVICIKFG